MRLDGVSFRYGRRANWVLSDVTVDIDDGEIVVVRGRNGAGKSTLLQLLVGVLRPTRGRILDRVGRVGWVPERFPADQPFTVSRYLGAMAALSRAGSPEPWIERLGLAPFRTVKLGELSKGTAQKVGLAQALIPDPDLLVLDEPWEGLDSAARELVPEIVAEVVAAGGAVIVSDHRGETARLPGATGWTVEAGRVTVDRAPATRHAPLPAQAAPAEDSVPAGPAEACVPAGPAEASAPARPAKIPAVETPAAPEARPAVRPVPVGGAVSGAPWLIEVAADDGPAAVAALRAAGHQIIRVHA
ncbi:ATP-binding cassette domain-containing protein [Rugosimonospora acidiphila]|uniref:ATP-binding cassette domain-containing protein n=1 Tax=Rugosimonospora acidiphila TaxID=556531 RepID=A0ABP9RJ76_9ACTN